MRGGTNAEADRCAGQEHEAGGVVPISGLGRDGALEIRDDRVCVSLLDLHASDY